MKRHGIGAVATACMVLLAAGCGAGEKKVELKDLRDKVSYSIGMNIGNDFKNQQIDVDPDLIAQGIKDMLAAKKGLLTEEEARQAIGDFQKQLMAKQEAKSKELGDKNLKAGEVFLAENGKKDGVVTLPSGLQYKVVKAGSGKKPTKESTVTVHYRGTLIDGKEFDSSLKRSEPVTFPVGGVIPGWTEALQLMQEGAEWQLFIPAKLAYGERGAGPDIGPNSTLIFDVQLIKVQ